MQDALPGVEQASRGVHLWAMTGPALAQALTDDHVAAKLAKALGSQYQLQRMLGRGGMGTVYLAREPFLERDVAVKALPAAFAGGDARERFLREARTAARLSHQHIVPLYTFGQADDVLYYVMGFVDGESLEARLRREGRLPPDDVRRIVGELADALGYAHSQGVIHRDVKPDNVLLERGTGRAMLTDFGVARQKAGVETLTQTGVIVGTPHYMSPEQASGDRDIDGRSDIYGLGVMAYRMATGRLPFEGGSLRELLAQHATRDPVAPTQLVRELPIDLDHSIMRALAKDPNARWPNARTMRDALSPGSEDATPEPLAVVSGLGPRLILIAAALAELAALGRILGFMDKPLALATLICAVTVPVAGMTLSLSAARKFGMRTFLTHAFRQPSWWTAWWPTFGRRHGDVWDRLPGLVRWVRNVNVWSVPVGVLMLNAMAYGMALHLEEYNPSVMRAMPWAAGGVVGLMMALLLPQSFRLQKRARSLGLTRFEVQRLIEEPTGNATFWSKPHIAAILEPAGAAIGAGERQPADMVRQIESLARAGASSPHTDLYREGASAARMIAAAVVGLEEQLARIARDADPRERERIEQSLASIGTDAGSVAKTRMRELMEHQLQIFRDLDRRREEVAQRRDYLREQLGVLAKQLSRLRDGDAGSDALDVTGRIRAIVKEAEVRLRAADEVRETLGS